VKKRNHLSLQKLRIEGNQIKNEAPVEKLNYLCDTPKSPSLAPPKRLREGEGGFGGKSHIAAIISHVNINLSF
jgi:hypothetical protein